MDNNANYLTNSPCTEPIKLKECVEYCKWHEDYTQKRDFQEFLTLMKYGMPQRKWNSNPSSDAGQKIATKLFNQTNVKPELKETQSPMPFSILCEKNEYKKDQVFYGEDIGWNEPACNDFFPAPTDQGMCMSANLNIQEIVHDYKEYDSLFESGFQKSSSKIYGGTMWSQKTYVISTSYNQLIKTFDQFDGKHDLDKCKSMQGGENISWVVGF